MASTAQRGGRAGGEGGAAATALQLPRGARPAPVRTRGPARLLRGILGDEWLAGYLFAAPMLVLLLGLVAWPLLQAVWMSFHNVVGPRWGDFVGLRNYWQQLQDPLFQRSVWLTVLFTAEAVAIKFVIGLVAALALHNVKRYRSVLTGLILAPFIVPEVVTAAIWRFLFNPTFGGLNATLRVLHDVTGGLLGSTQGLPWTGDPSWALQSMVAVNVWKGVPFFTLLALAGLKSIDREQYDAAAVDGANAWQRFLHVTLPGLRYVILVETLFSTISTFNTFGLVYLITQGGPGGATRLYALRTYELIGSLRYGQAVAVAMLVAPILMVAVIILGRYMRGGQRGDGEPNWAYRGLMVLLTPLRLLLRLVVAGLWLLNGVLERVGSLVAQAVYAVVARGDQRRARRLARAGTGALIGLTIAGVMFVELYPFYWIVITSFKTNLQITQFRSVFWPDPWTLEHFRWLFTESSFPTWLRNTVQVALGATAIGVSVSSLGAYALVRLRWRGAGFISTAILLTYLMPGIMLVVPLYQLFATMQIVNRLPSLMVAYPTFLMPFACWLLMGYYRSIPEELEEAAQIDGCNRFQAWYRIVLPLVVPALMAVALFAVTNAWNEFLFAFVFIQSNEATTLPVGLGRLIVGDVFAWGPIMAASVAMAIPVVAFYAMAQRFLVEGLTAGSVKG
ncbi:MAG TPA: ABC transporter permease subunit [Chloroflexota bacterium]|nr:ABC transporter permease subunit [Chloroflexota bacterium]